ncbi:MAG: Ig-like domain-containing protein, partial [Lachnospiraceae bacterium]|nr:Ig-like domain-containing protein [Lachnospiraceae bacterium]
ITAELICESVEHLEAKCVVTVKKPSLSINIENATLYTGSIQNTIKLSATVIPGGTIMWSSSDTTVAKVDRNGNVTAVGAGTCTIGATANGVSAACKITVKKHSLTLNKTSITIKKKSSQTLTATTTPTANVTWKSSNTAVATVSSSGVVKGIKKGNAVITATANGISKTCKVTVN